jgi:hypothetical protein
VDIDIDSLIAAAKSTRRSDAKDLAQDDQVEQSADRSLEEMIEKQAKEIEMKQLSEQKSKGANPPKISQAALALNSAEMGVKKEDDSQD